MAKQELISTSESSQQVAKRESLEESLGPQLRLFCYEYLVDFDHRRAASAASLHPDRGVRLLRQPEVTQYINLLTRELETESLITRDRVQHEILNEFLPMAKGEKDVHGVDRDGSPWSARVTNLAAYGKAIDLMSKHSGFTLPEVTQGGLTININHEALGITVEGQAKEIKDES